MFKRFELCMCLFAMGMMLFSACSPLPSSLGDVFATNVPQSSTGPVEAIWGSTVPAGRSGIGELSPTRENTEQQNYCVADASATQSDSPLVLTVETDKQGQIIYCIRLVPQEGDFRIAPDLFIHLPGYFKLPRRLAQDGFVKGIIC